MAPLLICATLFLPVPWRVLVGYVFPWSRWPRVGMAVFLVPLVAWAVALSVIAVQEGEYLVGLPILISGFWFPQFILIGFFAWCEREQSRASSREASI